MDSDSTLLGQMRRGDHAAARLLWERHGPPLVAYAASLLHASGGDSAAHDAVQSVMLRLLRISTLPTEDLRVYLTRAVRNEAISFLRSTNRRQAHESAPRPAPLPGADPTAPRDVLDETRRALMTLPEPLRETVLLKHVAGLTFDQMALATGEPRTTLASRYKTAVEELRRSALVQSHQEVAP